MLQLDAFKDFVAIIQIYTAYFGLMYATNGVNHQ